MVLYGQKVQLRQIQASDFLLLFKWVNNPKVTPFWHGKDKQCSMEWVKNHFTLMIYGKSPSQCFLIEVRDKPIGFMYYTPEIDEDDQKFTGKVEMDILIGEPDEWGKGYGTDAWKTMLKYAFEDQKAERVFLTPRISNIRAIHLYEKVGFKKEGVLRHFEKFEGKWIDCVMMAILREEYFNLKTA